jgi:hypothetical protein
MTKAGIALKCLVVEWGKYNINVTAEAPTFITTPGADDFLADPAHHTDVVELDCGAASHRCADGGRRRCRLPG